MFWTDEAIEVLKTLALQGRSARAIADALGAPSRSAVIGKANRIGVKLSGGSTGAERPRQASDASSRSGRQPGRPSGSARALVSAFPPAPRRPNWIFAEAEVGDMLKVAFEDISETNCRWPLGDPLSEEFVYCGLPPARGRSYCAGHCRLAYQPPKGTRDAGAWLLARLDGPRPKGGAAILPFPPPGCDSAGPPTTTVAAPELLDVQGAGAASRLARLAAS